MKLLDIFNQLSHGEFSQMNLSGGLDENPGEIKPAYYNTVLSHVNLGLTALHKRFNLKEGRVLLELQPGMFSYSFRSAYAKSNTFSLEPVKYIDDTKWEPFRDNLLKIERVYTESNYELGLNDLSDRYSLFTSSDTVLRVPDLIVNKDMSLHKSLITDTLTVVYRANHFIVNEDNGGDDPEDMEIDLPYTHLEALLYFIASRVHNPMGMQNEFHSGNSYAAKYEQECMRLEEHNLRIDQGSQNTRFYDRGWV